MMVDTLTARRIYKTQFSNLICVHLLTVFFFFVFGTLQQLVARLGYKYDNASVSVVSCVGKMLLRYWRGATRVSIKRGRCRRRASQTTCLKNLSFTVLAVLGFVC